MDNIHKLQEALQSADAVVIGAGTGLSTSARRSLWNKSWTGQLSKL